jgi:outer membrane protein assembly factor BamB
LTKTGDDKIQNEIYKYKEASMISKTHGTVFYFLLSALFLVGTAFSKDNDKPKWKAELDDNINAIRFIDNDEQHVLLASGKYVYLYDALSGQKVWNKKIDDYEKKGIRYHMIGDKFLVSTSGAVQCYDALTGKLLWETKLKDIDQSDFQWADEITPAVITLAYDNVEVGIDITTGKELWRAEHKMHSDLHSSLRWVTIDDKTVQLLSLAGDKMVLFDYVNGKALCTADNAEYNPDLVKNGTPVYYHGKNTPAFVALLDDEVLIFDCKQGKILNRLPLKMNTDGTILYAANNGCVVLGKEKSLYIGDNGNVSELNFTVSDFKQVRPLAVNNQNIALIALVNKMVAIDEGSGKVLWSSAANDPSFEGYIHRFLKQDGQNLICTYARPRDSGDEEGTMLFVMSVDALSGKVNFRTPVAFTEHVPSSGGGFFKAYLAVATMGLSLLANSSGPGENIGIDYTTMEAGENIVVNIATIKGALNPDTRKSTGEGFCAVNMKTGAVAYKNYFEVMEGVDSEVKDYLQSYRNGDTYYLVGYKKLAAFDLQSGKVLWTLGKELDGQVFNLDLVDGVLYAKLGCKQQSAIYDPGDHSFMAYYNGYARDPSIKFKKQFDKDPYGFAAIDPASGKLLWRFETDEDPSMAPREFELGAPYAGSVWNVLSTTAGDFTPIVQSFDFTKFYQPATKRLFYSDGSKIYALQAGTKGSENPVWTTKLGSIDAGKFDFEKSFSYNERKDEMAKPIGFQYDGKNLLAFGTDGIASVDPSTGKAKWTHEWDFSMETMKVYPEVVGDKIFYCVGGEFAKVNLDNGATDWQVEVDKKASIYLSPKQTFAISLYKDEASGFDLK